MIGTVIIVAIIGIIILFQKQKDKRDFESYYNFIKSNDEKLEIIMRNWREAPEELLQALHHGIGVHSRISPRITEEVHRRYLRTIKEARDKYTSNISNSEAELRQLKLNREWDQVFRDSRYWDELIQDVEDSLKRNSTELDHVRKSAGSARRL
jgi:hypothetical protein